MIYHCNSNISCSKLTFSFLRFLNRATIQRKLDDENSDKQEAHNPWKLSRVTQVENAKIILSMVPIFCCTTIMALFLAQLQTFSIQQGYTMYTSFTKHFHIPPASLPIILIVFLIIIVPMYDGIFVSLLRKITGIPTGVTHLQCIGVGLIPSYISMAVVSYVGKCKPSSTSKKEQPVKLRFYGVYSD